ncbi:MAG: GNAT family N-acetyltransferase [Acidimicrobiia bacterium]
MRDLADDPERDFYLSSFEGRVVVLAAVERASGDECRAVGAELAAAGAQVVVVVRGEDDPAVDPARIVATWHALGAGPVTLVSRDVVATAGEVASAARAHKLVVVDADLVVRDPAGTRRSFVDVARAGLPARLQAVARPLYEGVEGLNVVGHGDLDRELFTYDGAGTLMTMGDYGEVRRLGFADYAAVADLLRRGVDLGYLRPRSDDELESLLPRALGFFAAGDEPAGVVALADAAYGGSGLGELEALFTISRFHGEGVGRRLVEALDDLAAGRGLRGLFAVTSSRDAAEFFNSCGYVEVDAGELPAAKWGGYPPERRARVLCLRRDL